MNTLTPEAEGGTDCNSREFWEKAAAFGGCIGWWLLLGGGVLLAIGGGMACLPKAKGSVIGWVGGAVAMEAAAAPGTPCLWGRVLRKALGPAVGGGPPTAFGGVCRGGGCMTSSTLLPKHTHTLENKCKHTRDMLLFIQLQNSKFSSSIQPKCSSIYL